MLQTSEQLLEKKLVLFFDQILNTSFFDKEKLIIISRVTDKSRNIIEEIQNKKIEDINKGSVIKLFS